MLRKIQNSIFSKPLIIILIIALFNLSFTMPEGKVLLKEGTPLQLELVNSINSEILIAGQTIDFRVKYDIKVDSKVVIPADAIAKGQVIRVQKAKAIGEPAKVQIEIKEVEAIDGTKVYLSDGNIYHEGENKQTLSIILGIFVCIFCLLIKGEDVNIPSGKTFKAQVATNTEITVF